MEGMKTRQERIEALKSVEEFQTGRANKQGSRKVSNGKSP